MGYADGYYYGQGRIICDTSTFSVGDTIRVRSMTDSSKVWNQQVATVGTALVFTVPCYDYYKICTVQTINDTPTEIGGVYKTVDYGQTLFIDNMFVKSTLRGIQGILDNHNELIDLAIGDEVEVNIAGGTKWTFQVAAINLYSSHEVILVSKKISSLSTTNYIYTSSNVRTAMQNFYANIESSDKQLIKEVTRATTAVQAYNDYVWCIGKKEADGSGGVSAQSQFPLFTTQASRIKTYNGTASGWWFADHYDGASVYMADAYGAVTYTTVGNSRGVVPCFTLKADS